MNIDIDFSVRPECDRALAALDKLSILVSGGESNEEAIKFGLVPLPAASGTPGVPRRGIGRGTGANFVA